LKHTLFQKDCKYTTYLTSQPNFLENFFKKVLLFFSGENEFNLFFLRSFKNDLHHLLNYRRFIYFRKNIYH